MTSISIQTIEIIDLYRFYTHHKIADDNGGQEEGYTRHIAHVHTVPHGLDPFAAQHPEHDHKAVHEIGEVPPGQVSIREAILVICIVFNMLFFFYTKSGL